MTTYKFVDKLSCLIKERVKVIIAHQSKDYFGVLNEVGSDYIILNDLIIPINNILAICSASDFEIVGG